MDNYSKKNAAMLKRLSAAKWIWLAKEEEDQYIEIKGEFFAPGSKAILDLSCDGNYEFYLNGTLISFSQSPSHPLHPIVDSLVMEVKEGHNEFHIIAYHPGSEGFSSFYPTIASIIFAISSPRKTLYASGEESEVALSKRYISGQKKKVSPQLGYRPFIDLNQEDAPLEYRKAKVIDRQEAVLELRYNEKCFLDEKNARYPSPLKLGTGHYRFDFMQEQAGYLRFSLLSPHPQRIRIAYAEHLVDERLVYQVGGRDFSLEILLKAGRNDFFEGFLRVAGRYVEIIADEDFLEPPVLSIVPFLYPFKKKKYVFKDAYSLNAHALAERTLECCYHEHYEDCPMREQCLYTLDSLNQIDAGLLLFENKEQIRSSLRLFALCQREDGLLPICAPTNLKLTIPSFSLYYIFAVKSYFMATNDLSFLRKSFPVLTGIITAFKKRLTDYLLPTFEGKDYWNFYEWEEGLDGQLGEDQPQTYDIVLNSLFIMALEDYADLGKYLGVSVKYRELVKQMRLKAHEFFYDENNNLYLTDVRSISYSVLGNSLAILSGIAPSALRFKITRKLIKPFQNNLAPISLSMRRFLYDALLSVDDFHYPDFILQDIEDIVNNILQNNGSTFYETEEGYTAFDGAGSLCHGWGTVVVAYLYRFGWMKEQAPSDIRDNDA